MELNADLAVVRDEEPDPSAKSGAGPGQDPSLDANSQAVAVQVVAQPSRGRVMRWVNELPLALVIAGVGIGLVTIALHHFRWGSLAISVSVLAAGVFRLVLPARQAGLLVVRGRFTDVLTMAFIGGALFVLAAVTST